MGKQKGDAARSKARPSSSSQAAFLLQSGTSNVGFGGYVGSARLDLASTNDPISLTDVDGEVVQHLRRLSKRDPTTKVKALTSLGVIFKQNSASELSQIIPQWVFEYKRLAQDNNKHVRQAMHNAMTNLVVTIGRGLAPHLRSLMGAWWLAQFDPFGEVSEAARQSFQVAFPAQEKRLEALIFCENEIFAYLDENLKLTPDTISDKTAPIEELDEMHQRVVSSSLLALASLLDVLLGPPLQSPVRQNAIPENDTDLKNAGKARSGAISAAEKVCHSHKYFQEIVKSPSSRVRLAVYKVLGTFVKYVPHVYTGGDMKIIAGVVLGSLQEKDPTCHSSMWDMLLLFTRNFHEAWIAGPIYKVVLPRFWCFLRHGCYGSQQASYPCLLPLLGSIPPASVCMEQLLIDFFQNLWAGKDFSLASSTGRGALFAAVKECLLWGINNASRYVEEGEGHVEQCRVRLVEHVIFKLLWLDYVSSGKSNPDTEALSDKNNSLVARDIKSSKEKNHNKPSREYPKDFVQDLGKCIIEILSSIFAKYTNLLQAFITPFQTECLEIIQQVGNSEEIFKGNHCIDQISEFFLLLGMHSKNEEGDNWPLLHIARPFVAKSFPVIKYTGSPAAVRLLSVIISAFGPRVLLFSSFIHGGGESHVQFYPSEDDESKPELLLQFFKADFVPWCLNGNDHCTSSRLDLLLLFLEDAYFQDQWDWILAHAAELEDETAEIGGRCLNIDRVTVLAMLMEKVRYKFINQNVLNMSNLRLGFEAKHWYSRRLDDVAVAVVRHNNLKHPSCVRLLWSILGGAVQEDMVPLISKDSVNLIMEELLKHLVSVLIASSISWAKHVASLIQSQMVEECFQTSNTSSSQTLEISKFAAEVLNGSFFCLKVLDGDSQVVSHILAVVFCLAWESRMESQTGLNGGSVKSCDSDEEAQCSDNDDNGTVHSLWGSFAKCSIKADEQNTLDASHEQNDSKSAFVKSVHVLWSKTIASCQILFTSLTLERLRWVLIESIRYAIFKEQTFEAQEIAAMCTELVIEIMDYTCKDQDEQQQLLEQLLSSSDVWPLWAEPPVIGELKHVTLTSEPIVSKTDNDRHVRFVIFVDRIGSRLGKDKLFGRSLIKSSYTSSTSELTTNEFGYGLSSCRIWLAIEILCTWRWPGGSAVDSLLPFLCECAQRGTDHIERLMVDSIVNVLFAGALNNSAASKTYPLNVWVVSDDEVDKIEEPFLRALVMLLTMLFKSGSIWAKADAYRVLFDHFLNYDFLNKPAANGYLMILPNIMNVIVPTLRKRIVNSEKVNGDFSLEVERATIMREATYQWLQRALSGPPLILCDTERREIQQQQGVILHPIYVSQLISGEDVEEWIRVAVSCFPLSRVGGMAALAMASSVDVSPEERALMLELFRKQASKEALSGYHALAAERRAALVTVFDGDLKWEVTFQLSLAKLIAVAIGHCWQGFGQDEWVFVLTQLRKWLELVVRHMEELAEGVDDAVRSIEVDTSLAVDSTLENVEKAVLKSRLCSMDLAEMTVFIFSLICGLHNLEAAKSTASLDSLKAVNWERAETRALEDILRLFFATGISESIALSSCAGEKAGAVIARSRQSDCHFWESVAEAVLSAPSRSREAAVHAAELWGLSKGAVSALYAIIFTAQPIPALQWAAYHFLSTNPLQPLAITKVVIKSYLEESLFESEEADQAAYMNSSSEESSFIRSELAVVLQTPSLELLESHSTAHTRVKYLLAWSLFLTRLQGMPSLSAARERLVQYAQDSGSLSTLLDCLFHYIPLKQSSAPGSKKKGTAAVLEATSAATAAKRAAETSSLSFAVEALWPVGIDELSGLSGAIYGLMLRVLPACVRDWFTSLRDRSAAGSIEAFTTAWCSPQLLVNEFSQIQATCIADDSLSIKANRSTREITAIYKKEEAGMDVVIRLPSCYPLRVVDVDCTRKLGISETRLRKWMISMAAFVRNQNGGIAEAIHIWKRNVDREFEGVEECPICYSIIHTTNHCLPRLACKTCKYKFHSACLYKWFSTSHKSTCPLCQTPF